MPNVELPPTKSSLRKLKEDLAFAYEGYDLLNQKREILAIEIVRHIAEIRRVEAEFSGALEELYAAYRIASVDMGSEAITLKSCSEKRGYFPHMTFTKLMGLSLPKIRLSFKKPAPPDSLTGTTATYDTAKKRSLKMTEVLAELAAITKSIIMLSRELKKVQRRVNALEKIFIPQHEEAKKYISDRIEEMERDEIFVKKLIRQRASLD
ncbi:MAG: V-type ATP synthase subunit D [Deltaproteobacteria bacterium]|nr:V-type ATP synthase subunit D [Deltaproteobacteria bacterium]